MDGTKGVRGEDGTKGVRGTDGLEGERLNDGGRRRKVSGERKREAERQRGRKAERENERKRMCGRHQSAADCTRRLGFQARQCAVNSSPLPCLQASCKPMP
eukprot:2224495-Pleurochrysis_carterae.AAC.3